ncbi:TetR/AcrR family transcriptional regulator [Pseudonocardia sp. TRM90224]|uniref:TetR/AcrR family transcriptional regulator n=1 Tax=Pseudonocardia sp. TRM90224 TaxID=2812678 RepID=UPI001E618974|nr:TetR/AcrR family transcriptional regulator [Pseudonocardia sp. TRM90224]
MDDETPVELRRLWRLPTSSRMGRPAELDVERVVRATVELADRDGLAGVSLPKIARALGVTSMSLYRHVGSKDELLALLEDAATGPPPEIDTAQIDTAPGEWRAGLREWAMAVRRVYRRRPWLARIPITGPPAGPNLLAWMESALRVLRGTPLEPAAKLGVITLVNGYVRTAAQQVQDLDGSWQQPDTVQAYGRSLARLVAPDRFPELAKILASGLFESPPQAPDQDVEDDPDFTFGLDRILDGVETVVRERRPGQETRS